MAKFVIVIKVQQPVINGDGNPYLWEVRELLTDGTGDALERSGPTLAQGGAMDITTAKHDAETWAEALANQGVYIYNTTTQEPTPLP